MRTIHQYLPPMLGIMRIISIIEDQEVIDWSFKSLRDFHTYF